MPPLSNRIGELRWIQEKEKLKILNDLVNNHPAFQHREDLQVPSGSKNLSWWPTRCEIPTLWPPWQLKSLTAILPQNDAWKTRRSFPGDPFLFLGWGLGFPKFSGRNIFCWRKSLLNCWICCWWQPFWTPNFHGATPVALPNSQPLR